MSFPDPGSNLHIQSIDYACTFGQLPAEGGLVTFSCPDPVHFTFSFETGATVISPGVVQITWDYSWFAQVTVEADIVMALSSIVAAIAGLLSLTIQEVDQAVVVRRVWTYAPNVQGPGVSSGRVVTTDYMQYPPLVSGSDSVHAAGQGSVSGSLAAADEGAAAESASVVP